MRRKGDVPEEFFRIATSSQVLLSPFSGTAAKRGAGRKTAKILTTAEGPMKEARSSSEVATADAKESARKTAPPAPEPPPMWLAMLGMPHTRDLKS